MSLQQLGFNQAQLRCSNCVLWEMGVQYSPFHYWTHYQVLHLLCFCLMWQLIMYRLHTFHFPTSVLRLITSLLLPFLASPFSSFHCPSPNNDHISLCLLSLSPAAFRSHPSLILIIFICLYCYRYDPCCPLCVGALNLWQRQCWWKR